jgi:hypothetical protein
MPVVPLAQAKAGVEGKNESALQLSSAQKREGKIANNRHNRSTVRMKPHFSGPDRPMGRIPSAPDAK